MVRFYIVEDDALIRDGLRDCFPWEEVDCVVAGVSDNGAVACQEILHGDVDAVLTDVVLPGMSGVEMAQALRAAGWGGQLIMMSAYQDVTYLKGALQAQAVDFLFKPVSTEELMDCVRQAVERIRDRENMQAGWHTSLLKAIESCQPDEVYGALMDAWESTGPVPLAGGNAKAAQGAEIFEYCAWALPYEPAWKLAQEAAIAMRASGKPAGREFPDWAKGIRDVLRNGEQDWLFAARVTRLIRENLEHAEPHLLAQRMDISRASLYRQFGHAFTMGLNDYVTRIRMREASSMLLSPDARVYEAARRVGYSDVNYFARQFRREIGCLPSEYRALHQSKEGGDTHETH